MPTNCIQLGPAARAMACPARAGREQNAPGPGQEPYQPLGPGPLALFVRDEILPDFDLDVGDFPTLAVNGNAIVRGVAHMIGLIVADHEVTFLTEQIEEDEGQARIAVIEHSDMPGP